MVRKVWKEKPLDQMIELWLGIEALHLADFEREGKKDVNSRDVRLYARAGAIALMLKKYREELDG